MHRHWPSGNGKPASYGAAQTLLTAAANIHYSIAYVNRSTRLQGDGLMLVKSMRAVIDATDTATTLLVASLKTPAEVVAALTAGARDLTLPLALLREMGDHPLSEATIAEFGRVGGLHAQSRIEQQ
jgi:transaldolase